MSLPLLAVARHHRACRRRAALRLGPGGSRVGSINVAGIKYEDLTNYVRSAVARNFRNFDILVTMGQLRTVQIFVVGYARRPGNYTVSSLSTLMNAIFAAGGPSGAGSMRGIQLKRGNRTVTELDLYDLLLTGDKSKGVSQFDEFLAKRDTILPWIAEYSPYAHVSADDPPVYLHYSSPPALGREEKDPTHTANFGLKLQEHCKTKGVACELAYPGAENVTLLSRGEVLR